MLTRYVQDTFADVDTVTAGDATFFMYDPAQKMPQGNYFATITTADNDYDNVSKLDREGVYRLNMGISKATFRAMFPEEKEYDFAALDVIMPHPSYAQAFWICVVNPRDATFETLKPLLEEAYAVCVKKYGMLTGTSA